MPNMTTNHAITYANTQAKGDTNRTTRKTCKGRMDNTKRSPNPKLQNTERSFVYFIHLTCSEDSVVLVF